MTGLPAPLTGREAELQAEVERLRAALEAAERRAGLTASDQAAAEVRHATEVVLARTESADVAASSELELVAARAELAWAEMLGLALWLANTELAASQAALRESEARCRLILDSATDYAIIAVDPAGQVTLWNPGAERIFGWQPDEVLGRDIALIFTPEDRAQGRPALERRQAASAGRAKNERWHLRRDGSRFWASGLTMPMRGDNGGLCGFLKILRDQTGRREAARRRELLVAELNHRAKNMLATVQSLAAQTLKGVGGDPVRFARHFTARLQTLARAHDLLCATDWGPADFGMVARAALAPWLNGDRGSRVVLAGDRFMVGPRQAQALVLALHELATNAMKHGALSQPDGSVSLHHGVNADGVAVINWVEQGGPTVPAPPARQGFGTRLLERGLTQDLGPGSTVRLQFHPAGLRAAIQFAPAATGA
jgi:PAS domain S-box-containing protein